MAGKPNTAPLSMVEKDGLWRRRHGVQFYLGVINVFLLYYYTDVWGINPASAAFMFLITKVIDAFSDPVWVSSQTEPEAGGVGTTYLLGCCARGPWVICLSGARIWRDRQVDFCLRLLLLFMLAYTAINVPYSALLAVISPLGRATRATQSLIFASLGTLIVRATTKPLVAALGDGDEVAGFRLTMILFAVLAAGLFWFAFLQRKTHSAGQTREQRSGRNRRSPEEHFWIVLAIAGISAIIGLVGRISSAAFYTKYVLKIGKKTFFGGWTARPHHYLQFPGSIDRGAHHADPAEVL